MISLDFSLQLIVDLFLFVSLIKREMPTIIEILKVSAIIMNTSDLILKVKKKIILEIIAVMKKHAKLYFNLKITIYWSYLNYHFHEYLAAMLIDFVMVMTSAVVTD